MTELRTAALRALASLKGYRRELGCHQPCDAERALEAALAQPDEKAFPPWPPVSQWQRSCAVCNIGANGNVIGYVCSRPDCPTRITCGGTV